jgi:hypothetical protein
VLNGLYLLYTLQNLLGTIFRVAFAVLNRRIWSIVGKILYVVLRQGWSNGGVYKWWWPSVLATLLQRPISPIRIAGTQGAIE